MPGEQNQVLSAAETPNIVLIAPASTNISQYPREVS
jgi:hypothetical protein